MKWSLNNDYPVYMQILGIIRIKIVRGEYQAGSKLPSIRDISVEAAVNPNTVQKAIFILEQEGLVVSQRTVGKFITEDLSLIEKARMDLIENSLRKFLKKMDLLNFSKQDLIKKIQNINLKGDE